MTSEPAGPAADPATAPSAADPATDPWRALDEPGSSPARVDALARERLGRFAVDDVRRSAGLTSWLVRRAAADGSTTLDGTVWAAALRGYGIDAPRPGLNAASAAGRVVALPSERAIAHPRWGPLEGRIAEGLRRLLGVDDSSDPGAAGTLAAAPDTVSDAAVPEDTVSEDAAVPEDAVPGTVPDAAVEQALAAPLCAVLAGADTALDDWIGQLQQRAAAADRSITVIEDAHRLDLTSAAELVVRHENSAADGLVLVGDPDELEPADPGRFFGDVVDSGAVATIRLPGADDGPIPRLVGSLRAGELPPVEPSQHDVVVSPTADADQAVARVVELVTEALPRVLGVGPAELLALGIRRTGAAGVDALRAALDGTGCETAAVQDAIGRRTDAVVLVLAAESAGSLTRAHLISAASTARRHLSIVHQAGPALAAAVRLRPHRPRHTQLARLLRG